MTGMHARHVLLGALALALTACGQVVGPTTTTTPTGSPATATSPSGSSTPTASATAHTGVSEGETAALAAALVTVPGYTYQDVSAGELADQVANLPDGASGSFHSVVETSTGSEVAFLQFTAAAPSDAMWSEAYDARLAGSVLSVDSPASSKVAGHSVWFAEDAATPQSRYMYMWTEHGVLGWLDGPDNTAVSDFLNAYLAADFRGVEAAILADRMVPLAGWRYTDATDRADESSNAETLMAGATASTHYLFDRNHSVAGITLAGPAGEMTARQQKALVESWLLLTYGVAEPALTTVSTESYDGVTVQRLIHEPSGLTVYVWEWTDTSVVGWISTSRPDIVGPFITAFVTATPLP